MKQALTWAAGGTLFLFAMTTLGAATVFLFVREPRERLRRWLLGFAAGIMTAASVWSLLLPAMDRAAALGPLPWGCRPGSPPPQAPGRGPSFSGAWTPCCPASAPPRAGPPGRRRCWSPLSPFTTSRRVWPWA